MKAECRVAGTEVPWDKTGDVLHLACSTKGLSCKNDDQKDRKCEDYEVRYECPPGITSWITGLLTASGIMKQSDFGSEICEMYEKVHEC